MTNAAGEREHVTDLADVYNRGYAAGFAAGAAAERAAIKARIGEFEVRLAGGTSDQKRGYLWALVDIDNDWQCPQCKAIQGDR